MQDELDDRKKRVLRAVIDDYIQSAEPVGSRTLVRKYDLGVSPATIRNEMADLEMLGYLSHIHTSSGRIPSSKGYRFYVDGLIPPKPMSDEDKARIDRWYRRRVKRIDQVFQETAQLIAEVTKDVALVLAPQMSEARFHCIEFLPLDSSRVVAVLMTDEGFIENKIIRMPSGSALADFQRMAKMINGKLSGLALSEVQRSAFRELREAIGDSELYEAADVIDRALSDTKEERLYLGSTSYLLEQPEFHDVERVKEMLLLLEEQELVKDILHAHLGEGLEVTIGQENTDDHLKDTSLVTATYHLNGELLGAIAVMGPTRMEYAKAMSLIEYMNENMTNVIRRLEW